MIPPTTTTFSKPLPTALPPLHSITQSGGRSPLRNLTPRLRKLFAMRLEIRRGLSIRDTRPRATPPSPGRPSGWRARWGWIPPGSAPPPGPRLSAQMCFRGARRSLREVDTVSCRARADSADRMRSGIGAGTRPFQDTSHTSTFKAQPSPIHATIRSGCMR